MYLKRALEKVILQTSESFPVLLVTGPPASGKNNAIASFERA